MMKIEHILQKHSIIAVIGSRSQGKTLTTLSLLKGLRSRHGNINIAVMGVEPSIHDELQRLNISIIQNKLDMLDLKYKDTLIYVAEFGLLFSGRNSSREGRKMQRYFDRVEHNNCKLIIDTAREGFFNKYMSSQVTCCIVKQVEYSALVMGTWIDQSIKQIPSMSDYRLLCPINKYYVISNKEEKTQLHTIEYDVSFDTKKGNTDVWSNLTKDLTQEITPIVTPKITRKRTKKITQEITK